MARITRVERINKDEEFFRELFRMGYYSIEGATNKGTPEELYRPFEYAVSELKKFGPHCRKIWDKFFINLNKGGVHRTNEGMEPHRANWVLSKRTQNIISEMNEKFQREKIYPTVAQLIEELNKAPALVLRAGAPVLIDGKPLVGKGKNGRIEVKRFPKSLITQEENNKNMAKVRAIALHTSLNSK